jgi:plastocyanin
MVESSDEEEVSMERMRLVLVAALVATALVGAGCGGDDEPDEAATITETTDTDTTTDATTEAGSGLAGTVGPGFDISLETADGASVTTLAPGSYELTVEDLSSAHNFHLTGPGVDVSTSVSEEGTQTFTVELQAGTYEFVCDPHASQMNGSIDVS